MANIKKATENKSERHVKINLKTRNQKVYSPRDEILQCCERKVGNQKDHKNEPIILR